MTQDRPDRLDRIEATLDRVAQQLDNQVVVNAELRQSTAQLGHSVTELTNTVNGLTNRVSDLTNRVSDLTGAVDGLLQIVEIHQQNFEQIAARERRREEFERTTSAAIDRISTVLDYLVRRSPYGNEQP
ncbi:MAG: hypothetical protein V7K27_13625 [Nostoc sp.]|uniref:hypothetical protein n=1 Tax=Nostoc sp. TaxID=1180 RepID=UPI002FF85CB0